MKKQSGRVRACSRWLIWSHANAQPGTEGEPNWCALRSTQQHVRLNMWIREKIDHHLGRAAGRLAQEPCRWLAAHDPPVPARGRALPGALAVAGSKLRRGTVEDVQTALEAMRSKEDGSGSLPHDRRPKHRCAARAGCVRSFHYGNVRAHLPQVKKARRRIGQTVPVHPARCTSTSTASSYSTTCRSRASWNGCCRAAI